MATDDISKLTEPTIEVTHEIPEPLTTQITDAVTVPPVPDLTGAEFDVTQVTNPTFSPFYPPEVEPFILQNPIMSFVSRFRDVDLSTIEISENFRDPSKWFLYKPGTLAERIVTAVPDLRRRWAIYPIAPANMTLPIENEYYLEMITRKPYDMKWFLDTYFTDSALRELSDEDFEAVCLVFFRNRMIMTSAALQLPRFFPEIYPEDDFDSYTKYDYAFATAGYRVGIELDRRFNKEIPTLIIPNLNEYSGSYQYTQSKGSTMPELKSIESHPGWKYSEEFGASGKITQLYFVNENLTSSDPLDLSMNVGLFADGQPAKMYVEINELNFRSAIDLFGRVNLGMQLAPGKNYKEFNVNVFDERGTLRGTVKIAFNLTILDSQEPTTDYIVKLAFMLNGSPLYVN